MTDFKLSFETIQKEQQALNNRIRSMKQDAIRYCQEIIDACELSASDFKWKDESQEQVVRTRRTIDPRYRLPNGVEWTGMGKMKREFRDWLLSNGFTEEDKELFRIPDPKSEPKKPFKDMDLLLPPDNLDDLKEDKEVKEEKKQPAKK